MHTTSARATHAPSSSNSLCVNATWMFRLRISICDRTRTPAIRLLFTVSPEVPLRMFPGRHRNLSIPLTTTMTPSRSFNALSASAPPIASVRSRSNHRRTSASDAPRVLPKLSSDSNKVTAVSVVAVPSPSLADTAVFSSPRDSSPSTDIDAAASASHVGSACPTPDAHAPRSSGGMAAGAPLISVGATVTVAASMRAPSAARTTSCRIASVPSPIPTSVVRTSRSSPSTALWANLQSSMATTSRWSQPAALGSKERLSSAVAMPPPKTYASLARHRNLK